ncbi:VanW family protein [Microcystis elabens FACHB-917]|nr:VanW family protein [Microcystis elabens FACHB-917]
MRQEIRHGWRLLDDRRKGVRFDRAVAEPPADGLGRRPSVIGLTQPIMSSAFFESKRANICRGVALLDRGLIAPDGRWSFWHRVGHPWAANGFQPGRNIVAGRLVALHGGGLCQLSSLVYHLGLLGGLSVLERHPHGLDIYREEERFTPMGADATVEWRFKDLRLHNPHPFPVALGFRVERSQLIGELRAFGDLTACDASVLSG